ncbi:MAG: S41 family peptidase [Pseudomonadota bacterium]
MLTFKSAKINVIKKALILLAIFPCYVFAEKESEWFLHSSISPNGNSIAFSYKGDIYVVPATGGTARALTIHKDYDGYPIWSRDGKNIAFASDRNGNMDIYLMPASGGTAKRLTYHSSNDYPQDFTKDGDEVIFTSSRKGSSDAIAFPTRRLTQTYSVSIDGGTPRRIASVAMSELSLSPSGNQILFRDEKSYETPFRKHDVSAFARDIWQFDIKKGTYKKLTDFKGADHNPVWMDRNTFYYTSEEGNGAFNVWRSDIDGQGKSQITSFKQHPVRSLSISKTGVLAFVHHGSIYTLENGKPNHVKIDISNDVQEDPVLPLSLNGSISEFSVSPDGKEVAFIARGEVFVASTEFETTRTITNTPGQERSVSFHKDGRTILYASERDGRWGLYEASIADEDEPYFFAATQVKEEPLHVVKTDSFQPVYSPDGKKVAFLSARDEIQVIDRETKKINVALGKEHNYSYADGDITFAWAPDSSWMTADFAPRGRLFLNNIGVFPADGNAEPIDISLSGYRNYFPQWHKDGHAVLWSSARYGQRDHGSWGVESDVMAAFLTQDSFDKFRMSEEEYALFKELEEKESEEESDDDKTEDEEEESSKDDEEDEPVDPLDIEWDNIQQRTVRLTIHSSDLGDAFLTKDTEALYYLARFEDGYDLWRHQIKESKTELVSKLGARFATMSTSDDGETLYVLADGRLSKGELGDNVPLKSIFVNPVIELHSRKERAFMFAHSWRVINDKFYKNDMHGIDWNEMKEDYQPKLASVGHGYDFGNLFAEMTGELNASHIGAGYIRPRESTDSRTAALGLFLDLSDTSGALEVLEVIHNGPFDTAKSNVKAGDKLIAINGVLLDDDVNLYHLLNRKIDKRIRLTFEPKRGDTFDEVIKPISLGEENELVYQRWVDTREALVESLSNGRLGYVHIRAMNDASFRSVYSRLLGKHFDKEAVVVDTRFNSGGWLHNDLAKLFGGEKYLTMHVRGRQYAGDPLDQWYKPSILVINEGNYSDGHAIAFTYETLGLGDSVGMPVPGTMTAVWWETGISGEFYSGVPQVGMKNMQGEYLENMQTEPDHLVNNDPESLEQGKDKQIEKAVSVLLQELDSL